MKRHPTVIDVAKLAGVGPSTVSRFLRGVNISSKTAARVADAIRKTGYQPDAMARALRQGVSRSIGVVLPKVSNAFFGNAVQFVEQRARDFDYTVILVTHQDQRDEQEKLFQMLRRCRVDGVLLSSAPGTTVPEVRAALSETPVVCFDALFSNEFDAVVLQNHESARNATEHLLAHGHKRIAAVTAKPDIYSFRERIQGFTEAMHAHALKPELIVGCDYDELRHRLRSLVADIDPPDALLSLSDFATLNVIRIFDEARRTPDQWIPIIGFDDFPYAPLLGVPMTVVKQPVEEMIRTAFHLLMNRIQEQNESSKPEIIKIPGELIRRRSCGCA